MKRTILTAIMMPALWSAGAVHAANPVYSAEYAGGGNWVIRGEVTPPAPKCALSAHDRTISVETGDASRPVVRKVIVPLFFQGPGEACGGSYPFQYRPPFSFVAVMAPSKGLPGVLNLSGGSTLLQVMASEEGVSIERTGSDISGGSTFKFYPWDFRFTPQAYNKPGIVVLVGTVQQDGKFRIDVRDGARGAWLGTVIDGGWPTISKGNNTYAPAMPNFWFVNEKGFPSTLSYFAIYNQPLMETKRWDGQEPPTVNYMSSELYSVFRDWTLVDQDNLAPQNKYLPCNSGHWLPKRAPKTKVGPIPLGVRLCKVGL